MFNFVVKWCPVPWIRQLFSGMCRPPLQFENSKDTKEQYRRVTSAGTTGWSAAAPRQSGWDNKFFENTKATADVLIRAISLAKALRWYSVEAVMEWIIQVEKKQSCLVENCTILKNLDIGDCVKVSSNIINKISDFNIDLCVRRSVRVIVIHKLWMKRWTNRDTGRSHSNIFSIFHLKLGTSPNVHFLY